MSKTTRKTNAPPEVSETSTAPPAPEMTLETLAAFLQVEPRALREAAGRQRMLGNFEVQDSLSYVRFAVRRELLRSGISLFREVPVVGGQG